MIIHCAKEMEHFLRALGPVQSSNFCVPNLNAIWVDPNDIGLTDDSEVELNWSESIHFHDIRLSAMLTNENKLQ